MRRTMVHSDNIDGLIDRAREGKAYFDRIQEPDANAKEILKKLKEDDPKHAFLWTLWAEIPPIINAHVCAWVLPALERIRTLEREIDNPRLVFIGKWIAGASYRAGQVAALNDAVYLCTRNGATEAPDTLTDWMQLGGPSMKYRGVFDRAKSYRSGDWVTFDGSAWCCLRATEGGIEPGGGEGCWQLAVKRGRDGKSSG